MPSSWGPKSDRRSRRYSCFRFDAQRKLLARWVVRGWVRGKGGMGRGTSATRTCSHSCMSTDKDSDNPVNGTDNADKATDNPINGTDTSIKDTERQAQAETRSASRMTRSNRSSRATSAPRLGPPHHFRCRRIAIQTDSRRAEGRHRHESLCLNNSSRACSRSLIRTRGRSLVQQPSIARSGGGVACRALRVL